MLLNDSSKKNTRWWLVGDEIRNQGVENAYQHQNKIKNNIGQTSKIKKKIEYTPLVNAAVYWMPPLRATWDMEKLKTYTLGQVKFYSYPERLPKPTSNRTSNKIYVQLVLSKQIKYDSI